MLVEDLLGRNAYLSSEEKHTIRTNCSQFIKESTGLPLFKTLPSTYQNFQRVKARLQKKQSGLAEIYNHAFEYNNLRQRAVFAYATPPTVTEHTNIFYVFPKDGYKFLYCKEVTDSNNDYQHVIDALFEQFNDTNAATEIITDLLKYTYLSENLYDGIISKAEIILYNIPQYYAVRVNALHNYNDIINQGK